MKLRFSTLLAALAVTLLAQKPVKIVLVGDSTVNDEGGWGPGFKSYFGPKVEVVNLALNGRSSESFRGEGHWPGVLAAKGDYVLIQFGHNDNPGKGPGRETDAATTYRANLARYIDEVRAYGGTPVLVTSITRRNFGPDGKIKPDALLPYVDAVRIVAKEKGVPLMDLYPLTVAQAEALGPVETEAKIDARDKDGKPDHTHLGPQGRQEIGVMAAKEFVRVVPAMSVYVRVGQAFVPAAAF